MIERVLWVIVSMLSASSFCCAATPASPPSVPYRFQNVTFLAGGFITGFVAHPAERGLYYVRTDIGGAYRWDRASRRWSSLQDWLPFSERNLLGAESLAIDPTDPNKVYIAAGTYINDRTPNGAILRSSDQGRHFTVIHVPFKIGGNEEGRFAGERLQTDPNHPQTLLMGTRLAGLWRSDDSGITWTRVLQFPSQPANRIGLTFVTFDRSSGHPGQPTPVIYVGVDDPVANLLRSEDAGKTWKTVAGSPQGMFPNHGIFSSDGTMYLSLTDHPGPNGIGNGAVWAFVPATNTWRDITPQKPGLTGEQQVHAIGAQSKQDAQGFGYGVVVVDQQHPKTLLASTIDRWHPGDTIFRSADGGAHWQSLKEGATRDSSLAPYLKHVAPEPPFGHWIGAAMIDPFDSAHVLYGTGETIWESHDVNGGAITHWMVGAVGLEETADIMLLSPASPNGPHLYTGLGDIGCYRNDDFTRSPADGAMKSPELSNCDALALAADKPDEMVRVGRSWTPGASHGAVSHDGGLHWTPFASEPKNGDQGGDATISADGSVLLWSTRGGPVSVSDDGGGTWRPLSLKANDRASFQVLADANKPRAFWIYNPGAGVLFAQEGAADASMVSDTVPKGGKLRIAANAPDVLWIANSGGLWRSTDRRFEFEKLTSVAAAYAVGFGKSAPNSTTPAIYLAGAIVGTPEAAPPDVDQTRGGGIYRSLDSGETWQRIDDPLHRYAWIEQITGDPRIFGRLYMGTNGRGVIWGDAVR